MKALLPHALAALVVAFGVAFTSAPWFVKLALRLRLLDHPAPDPEGYKRHVSAVPYLGGLSLFLAVVVGALFLVGAPTARSTADSGSYALAMGIAVALGAVGLMDDVRNLPPSVRLVAEIAAAVAAWGAGFRVLATTWTVTDFLLTVFWIVGITNAFNLLDNIDGLSGGLAGVGAFGFAVMGFLGPHSALTVVAAALAGAAFGFLAHNRHPAKVFMGDGGALFLGFLLAIVGLDLRFENIVRVTFLVPVVVLGLPIFDTTLVVLSRLRHGRPIFSGSRDHVSHRLIAIGLPVRTAVGLLYWCGLCLGWLGLVISRSNTQVGWMLLGFVMALGVFFGWLLWRVPVYEAWTLPRQRRESSEDRSELSAS